ncbi:hypothetical protein AMS68_002895 [Peltaster fructicola]|uniref:Mid2 domain-containing protein n=1 Tax=Peltaster fructicola TaxID=286661 RepID=A0A6H0XRX5_9PEZI|nr:hypothetical protein AMS68_002895 [Peltaster fructicola]
MASSTTATAAAAATTADPEVWIYPPPANYTADLLQPASNGPVQVFYGDWMIVQWDPPTQSPYIGSACQNETGAMLEWAVHTANTTGSPLTYQFTRKADSNTPIGTLYCHFWFYGTRSGNSVTFVYSFDQRLLAATYSATAASASSTISSSATSHAQSTTGSVNTASITGTAGSVTGATATASTTGSATSVIAATASGGLSAGASAGIGVGVALGVLLLALVAVLLWRKRKRSSKPLSPPEYGQIVYHKEVPATVEVHGQHVAEPEGKRLAGHSQPYEMS